jgi:hypothetical protein
VFLLDLFNFKIAACNLDQNSHNLKKCPYYHDANKDRRRPLGRYQSEICTYVLRGERAGAFGPINCPNGDNCDRAHNRVEEFYHPDKYKAKFCATYLNPTAKNSCEYDEFCSFAHNEQEISVELIEKYNIDMDFYFFHFKTVWCPYREDDHDRKACVYAHNWQDYRRKPQLYTYSSKMCPAWHTDRIITSYPEGCQQQYQCGFSHGWKEQEYHPEFFKTKECKHGARCEKVHCPYFHNELDRR